MRQFDSVWHAYISLAGLALSMAPKSRPDSFKVIVIGPVPTHLVSVSALLKLMVSAVRRTDARARKSLCNPYMQDYMPGT
ncbi:hypothetical protein BO70DRAFT_429921 [Aspergillus heteromorphus CBS 117.55]|uniref:Uncharacterized protein n=1 Tax=Aspergillus heteromorphus CBS 117.55 TaxID=1448321 RepID=A0A317W3B5_9EURO|nr:uncharacterized protein BO70DRAFT_429921 [Aspergillus heteromorphus CBS 117.55]PWY79747.1 hypothetical protein BO70DRAFT_429921 [Aspergillus heteromorphus CBS 117.55]